MGAPRATGDRADALLQHTDRRVSREAGISVVIWANQLVRAARRRHAERAKEICPKPDTW